MTFLMKNDCLDNYIVHIVGLERTPANSILSEFAQKAENGIDIFLITLEHHAKVLYFKIFLFKYKKINDKIQ